MKPNKMFKKFRLSLRSKKTDDIETDAAPSRPRTEEEMSEPVSSSEDDEECNPGMNNNDGSNYENVQEEDEPEIKTDSSYSANMKGQTFVQNHQIHIHGSSGIHIGNTYNLNVHKGSSQKTDLFGEDPTCEPQKPKTPPPNIEKTFSNRKAAETTDFISIKFDIGSNWRQVAVRLGLSDGVIQQVHHKYKERGISEVFYQLMLKWKESQPRTTTTVGLLCEELWNSNETSAANTLAKLHPTN